MFDMNEIMRREEEQALRQRQELLKHDYRPEDDLVQVRTLAGLEFVHKSEVDSDIGVFDSIFPNMESASAYELRMHKQTASQPSPSPVRKSLTPTPANRNPTAYSASESRKSQKVLKGFRIDAPKGSYLDLAHLWD